MKRQYFGGKNGNGTYQTIINHFPPHTDYIECFLGSGAIIRNKKKAIGRNIGIELNSAVIDKYHYDSGSNYVVFNKCVFDYLIVFAMTGTNNRNTLLYLDPPYPLTSRKNKKAVYKYELTDKDHIKLLEILKRLKCNIAISTYENKIYSKHLKNWNVITFESQTRKGKAIEYLYMNYDTPKELHEYTFLGTDFIDRQRIKRRIALQIKKLLNMPTLERQAILEAIKKFDSGNHIQK